MAESIWSDNLTRKNGLDESSDFNAGKWLSLALESAKMCAYKWDLETNMVTRSHQSSLDSRVDPPSDSWVYYDGIKYVHQVDRELVQQKVSEAINSHQDFNIEFRAVEN